jgi:signal transduction histidine kinase
MADPATPVTPVRPVTPVTPVTSTARSAIDWRLALMVPPRRRYTPGELAQAGAGEVPATVAASAALNAALLVALYAALAAGRAVPWALTAVLLLFGAGLVAALSAAWRDPGSRAAQIAYWGLPVTAGFGLGALLQDGGIDRGASAFALLIVITGSAVLWFTIVHRHQFIAMRLQEAAERERSMEMARRLAAAQLEPHFLFNTLASLQHWVETRDDRAAPTLRSLTGYLRATLPLFGRPLHPLADELAVLQRYLEVMQARLGARLRWSVEVDPALQSQPLPPGLLLTLVENAVEHGVEPQLRGGRVVLAGRVEGDEAVLEVHDDGPGLPPGAGDGIGLANCRERLALTCGPRAGLRLRSGEAGGCVATLRLPRAALPPPAPPQAAPLAPRHAPRPAAAPMAAEGPHHRSAPELR